MNMTRFVGKCSYNQENKEMFRRAAMAMLRKVALHLRLPTGSFEVRFNPGGIAVSGDATLHSEGVYVTLNADGFGLGVLVRSCKGRKDYAGGRNCWFPFDRLTKEGASGLAEFAEAVAAEGGREVGRDARGVLPGTVAR
jgi:hypothetical protein